MRRLLAGAITALLLAGLLFAAVPIASAGDPIIIPPITPPITPPIIINPPVIPFDPLKPIWPIIPLKPLDPLMPILPPIKLPFLPIDPTLPLPVIPALPPSSLIATEVTAGKVSLKWTNVYFETGYEIYRKLEGSLVFLKIGTTGKDVCTYTDATVSPLKTYTYYVRSFNSFGKSAPSPELTVFVPIKLIDLAPKAPTALAAAATGISTISLAWVDQTTTETGYKVERRSGPGAWSEIASLPKDATSFNDTGLSEGTRYYYRVLAHNAFGSSPWSNEATAKTLVALFPEPIPTTVVRLYVDLTYYYVNDVLYEMNCAPKVIGAGRTVVPIRFVVQPLGAGVEWSQPDQKVTITFNGKIVELWVGKCVAHVNGVDVMIDATDPAVVPINTPEGRVMMPVRFITETLGCDVAWDAVLREVKITHPKP